MFEQERKIYRFQRGYGEMLLAGIDPRDAFEPICAGGSHPAWIIGHLAFVAHNNAKRLGGAGVIEDEGRWKGLFGGGSKPTPDASQYPGFDEIAQAWRKAHDAFDAAAASAAAAVVPQPNPAQRMREALPTLGDLTAFLMTGHEGMHLGQLSAWRRIRGMPAMF